MPTLERMDVSTRPRRAGTGLIGIFVATLAAFADLSLAEELTSIDPPARPGSSHPAIASEGVTTLREEHDVLMTWLEPGPSGMRLRFSRLADRVWSPPVTIADPVSALGPMDRSSLTVLDTQAVRRTLIARTGDVVARSGDAGRTWARLPAPALPFASFAGGDQGGYAFWLDPGGDDSAKLLGARILSGEALLDPGAADGSSTSAAMTWDGPVVVYRDQSIEDIVVVRRQDAQWTRPRPVHHVAGWRPAQRPKSGPEVAASRRQLAVAWYTEVPHRPRVLVAFSSDAGKSFGAPVEVAVKEGDRTPLAAVDVDLDSAGDALVLWLATTGSTEANLNLARVSADGERGKDLVLAEGLDASAEAMPQIARAGNRAAVTWIASAPGQPESGRVRAVAVPFTSVSAPGGLQPDPGAASEEKLGIASRRGRVGEHVPDLELTVLDGEKVSLESLRGRPVLLNLWATWCLPCIAEMPELATLHDRYADEDLVLVGLSFDDADATDKVRAFVAEYEVPFAVWLDPAMRVFSALRVKSLPVTLVLDREGQIAWRRDGRITADDPELRDALSRALSEAQ